MDRGTGGDILARHLAAHGVRHVFGVPGVQLDFAVDALARIGDRVCLLNTRHEQATSYMADGYARATGEVGVCLVVPGPGLLNALAGLATAYACSSPVLCIAGQIPSPSIGRGFGLLHEIPRQSAILGALTKWHGIARAPEEVAGLVHQAFAQVRSDRPRPVGMEIPPDVLQGEAWIGEPAAPAGQVPAQPDPEQLDRAAALLARAARPVIVAGGGVLAASAGEELRALAEALQAPVVMTNNGRGALSDRHHLALTSLGGRAVLPDADVVLAAGTRFMTSSGRSVPVAPAARVVMVNADPADMEPPRQPEVAVRSDARLGLAGLVERVEGIGPRASRLKELERVRAWCREQVEQVMPQAAFVDALRAAIPDDGILVTELTQVGYLAQVAYPVYEPRTMITPGYQGTLGYGFPTALGARVGRPDRAVVSITGDGGFGWCLQELSTARKYGIGAVTVVFNDNAFGNVRRSQKERFDGRFLATDLVNPDFVKLAESFGVAGERATSPDALREVLPSAIAAGEPVLIEVPVGEMPSPWPLVHPQARVPQPWAGAPERPLST